MSSTRVRYTVVRVIKRPRKDGGREVSEVWFKNPLRAERYARAMAKRLRLTVQVGPDRGKPPWQRAS
jgi:hypothetical protein